MKTCDLFKKKTVLSFEVFPPKRTDAVDTVYSTVAALKELTRKVQRQIAYLDDFGRLNRTPQGGADTCAQHGQTEGLDDVVICTRFQTGDLVALGIACGQKEDGDR